MTENDATAWIEDRFGSVAIERIRVFLELLMVENMTQNLIAPSTIPTIWNRHVLDSAQLVPLANPMGRWIDVGTGGGFPGIIVAILYDGETVMVEPRRRRAEFLGRAVDVLGLVRTASIIADKVERVSRYADVISARAVASPEKLLQATRHCATPTTRWLLPRGRSQEVPAVSTMMFHVEQSLTDNGSHILIAEACP